MSVFVCVHVCQDNPLLLSPLAKRESQTDRDTERYRRRRHTHVLLYAFVSFASDKGPVDRHVAYRSTYLHITCISAYECTLIQVRALRERRKESRECEREQVLQLTDEDTRQEKEGNRREARTRQMEYRDLDSRCLCTRGICTQEIPRTS